MPESGVKTTNFNKASALDEVIGNRDGSTVRQSIDSLAIQIAVKARFHLNEIVACATTANITLSGEQTIDGVTTSASRVLVKNQSTAAQNGIYVTASGAWSRASDMDTAGEVQGAAVYVSDGTANAGKTFYTGSKVATLGTDAVDWVLSANQGALVAEVAALGDDVDDLRLEYHQRLVSDSGNVISDTTPTVGLSNGATATPGTTHGITIPSGQTGATSYLRPRLPVDYSARVGETVRFALVLETSATFTRQIYTHLQIRNTSLATLTRSTVTSFQEYGDATVYFLDYEVVGDENEIRPYLQVVSGPAATADETMELTAFSVYTVVGNNPATTAGDLAAAAQAEAMLAEAIAATQVSMGDQKLRDAFNYRPANLNNAVTSGFMTTIPAGETGDNTLLYGEWNVQGAAWAGRVVEVVQQFETGATFNRVPDKVNLLVGLEAGGSEFRSGDLTNTISVSGTTITVTSSYTIQGDEAILIIGPQLNGGGAAASDETIELTSWTPTFTSVPDGSATDANLTPRLSNFMSAPRVLRHATPLAASVYDEIITVSPGGGGDFTDLAPAFAAQTRTMRDETVLIDLAKGEWEFDTEIVVDGWNYVYVIGRGPQVTRLRYDPGAGASQDKIQLESPFLLKSSFHLEAFHTTAIDAKYVYHPESAGHDGITTTKFADRIWGFQNLGGLHLGSPNSTDPASNKNVIGSGTSSGKYFYAEDCYFEARDGSPFACHNNGGFKERTLVELRRNHLIASLSSGRAVSLGFLQSGRADRVVLEGNSYVGDIYISETALPGVPPADFDPSLHSEIQISGYGNGPAAVTTSGTSKHYYPRFTDEEAAPFNNSGAAIAAGDVLAWDGDRATVRKMTSADSADLFAGVALTAIADQENGRVKVKGWLHLDYFNTAESSLTFGATMSVGATAGVVAAGGAQGILRAVRGDVVEVA